MLFIAVRRRRPGEVDDSPQKRQPVPLAHVDQTTAASITRVHRHLPAEDVPELLKKRFQIVSWLHSFSEDRVPNVFGRRLIYGAQFIILPLTTPSPSATIVLSTCRTTSFLLL